MKTRTFYSRRPPLFTFDSAAMRLIGGSVPQTTRRQARDAIKSRCALMAHPMRHPYVHFLIYPEPDELAPTHAAWLRLAEYLMRRIGAGNALWWAFLQGNEAGATRMHITAHLVDSSGGAVGSHPIRLGRLNVDGSIRTRTAASRVPESAEAIKPKEKGMKTRRIENMEAAMKLNVGRWHEDIFQMAKHQELARLALDDPYCSGSDACYLRFPVCGVSCWVSLHFSMLHPNCSRIKVMLRHESHEAMGEVELGGEAPKQSDYWVALEEAANELAGISDEFRRGVERQIWRNTSVSHD